MHPTVNWFINEYLGEINIERKVGRFLFFAVPTVFLFLVVGIPIVFFFWASFWTEFPGLGGSFTLEGYKTAFSSTGIRQTIVNTLILAVGGTIIALFSGITTLLFTLKFKVPSIVKKVAVLSMVFQLIIPNIINAIAWTFYAGPDGPLNQALMAVPFINSPPIKMNIWLITFIMGTHYAGLVYLLTSGAIKSVPPSLEEAGIMSGAKTRVIFSKITLRLAIPSITISAAIVFSRLVQSFGLPLILGLPNDVFVLATLIYFELQSFPTNYTMITVLGVLILIASLTGLFIQRYITGASEKYETIIGGGERNESLQLELGKFVSILAWIYFVFLVLVYVVPIIILVMSSFQQVFLGFQFELVEWTLSTYSSLFMGRYSGIFYNSVRNSIIVGILTGIGAIVLAIMISYLSIKTDSKLGVVLDYLSYAPVAIPGIILSTAIIVLLLNYWNVLGLYGTIWLIGIAFIAKFLVYGVRATNSSLRSIGTELEEAALLSGARKRTIFTKIYAPLSRAGIASGFVIILIDTTKSLSIPLLLGAGRQNLLQSAIWILIANGEGSTAAALSVLMMLLIVGVYAFLYKVFNIDITEL